MNRKNNRKNRMPKAEYFKMRLENAIANGLTKKAEYYAGRLAQMNESSDDTSSKKEEDVTTNETSNDEYKKLVKKCVNVLNAPKGTVQQKMGYIFHKLKEEGVDSEKANIIWLEALNIASNGELLSNI